MKQSKTGKVAANRWHLDLIRAVATVTTEPLSLAFAT